MSEGAPLRIEATGLSRVYGRPGSEIAAVSNLSLRVPAGTVYALLGPNGAGKTTTISMLTTLIPPSSGRARVAGYDIGREPDRVRAAIGVTFQESILDPSLTGREILDLHGRLYRMARAVRHHRIESLVSLVELTDAIDRRVATYSGGMKRRLDLIRALLPSPKVLFLDEPTQGLDPQNRARIWDYLHSAIRARGLTVLLTTHSMEEAEALADRVGILDHGRLVVEGRPVDLAATVGADVITIRGQGAAESLVAALEEQAFVRSVQTSMFDGQIDVQIGLDQGHRRLAGIVMLAAQRGFAVDDISITRPSLGDVFLKYTGRALRDR